ncbi:MAG: aldehyde dehydrogenase family protein [Clostridiaceae bacterium]|nr:aldehyde dehydrogenase family protein [Clostridiaceae bacterium]
MENEKYIKELMEKARIAQKGIEDYSQEQIDRLVKVIGKTVYDNAEMFAKEAVEETGFGLVQSKIFKKQKGCAATWQFLKDKKSVGLIEVDEENGLLVYAKPIGVGACICPSTNPVSTVAHNGMSLVKCRNAMIVAPHPSAKKCTAHGVHLINEALKKAGAPENLIQVIEEPSLELSQLLMQCADVVIATGGPGMVKSAYSSGKPSYGVGPGNMQVLFAEDYEDYEKAAELIVNNRNYDYGIPCTSEQFLIFPKKKQEKALAALKAQGAFLIEDEDQADIVRKNLFLDSGRINVKFVGMGAAQIAKELGIEAPENTRMLLLKAKGSAKNDVICREKLCPVDGYFAYDNFEEGLTFALDNLLMEGKGHSSVIYSNDDEVIRRVGEVLPVGRILVNQAGSTASGGSLMNGLAPTLSLGCGFWGNNSISENLTYKHLMNITRVAYVKKNATPPDYDKIWED